MVLTGSIAASTSLSLTTLAEDGAGYRGHLRLESADAVVGVQIDLSYDPDRVTVQSILKGAAAGAHLLSHRTIAPGLIRAVLTSPTSAIFNDGNLFTIVFESAEELAATDRVFSLRNLEFSTRRALGVSAALVPYVEIVTPAAGGSLALAESVSITAITVATEGEVDRVEFFAGDLRIGVASAEPYSVSYFPTALGSAIITAVSVSEGGAAGRDAVAVDFVGDPYYSAWRSAEFTPAQRADVLISGPLADPDFDRLPNLMEYFFGLGPLHGDVLGERLEHGTVEIEGERYLTLTVRKPIAVNDVNAAVAGSSDLTFSDGGTAVLQERRIEGAEEILTYRDAVPLSASAGRFLRAAFDFTPVP